VRIDVLGTPCVTGGDAAVSGARLGGRRALVVLVALALEGSTVSAQRLAEMVWADDPPPTWPVALRGVVRELRAALEPIGGGGQLVIATEPPGYRIGDRVDVDVVLAEEALREAAQLLGLGRYRAALELAHPISAMASSQLLPGEDGEWLRPHRDAIDARARQALEILTDAAGQLGDHLVAVAAARRAVAADALDEHAHRSLIRALDRAGDRAGAVRAFEECRTVLADHLGVDPSAETVQAYLATLRDQVPSSPARIPAQTSSFVGRAGECAALTDAIGRPGLVSVTGVGGVGKSRVAARVAATPGEFPGGRLWVSLGQVAEDALVASTVALTLGVQLGTDDAAAAVICFLAPLGRTLLVLDGCEVALDGVASLVSSLVAECPFLTVVTTGRAPLRLDGEVVLHLEPMPEPSSADPAVLQANALVRLLLDRVHDSGAEAAVGATLRATRDASTATQVLALIRRCAGLPLAVELVAAQLAATAVGDLVDQLDQLDPLVGDDRDPLRAIARGSYTLLDEHEAAVFRRFAVLDGSVGLALVRQVVSGDAVAPVRVVRILRELTARGLIGVDRTGTRWRYHQDDDLHRFARELLRERGEEREAFDRLAEAIRAALPDDAREPPMPYRDTITDMLGSVRSLFAAGLSGHADAGRCLELAFRLHRYWAATNVAEGRFWLSRLVSECPDSPWLAYATYALGYLDYWSGDADAAIGELETVVSLLTEVEDPYVARALIYLAGLLDDLDRETEAIDYVRRAIRAARPFGTDLRVAAAMGLGSVLSERGDPEAAEHARTAIELCRKGGSVEQLAAALPTAAMVCWQVGANEQARMFADEARPLHASTKRIARVVLLSVSAGLALGDGDVAAAIDFGSVADQEGTELGVEREMPLIRAVLARAHLAAGDIDRAVDRSVAAVEAALGIHFGYPLAVCLETAVLVLRVTGGAADADLARLIGTAAAIRRHGSRPPPASLARDIDAARDAAIGAADDLGVDPRVAGRLAIDLLLDAARPAPASA
jgi:predicted ATPase/DNA-binding SARP family transcriptional activator